MRADRVAMVALLVAGALAGCSTRGAEPSGADLFARIRPSLALISTPSATGSAELIDDGYLVTDAHVVDPYRRVDVQFEGEDWIEQVPVVGVDLVADLAVVGPVEVDAPPLDIQAPERTRGGRAYLMGYPGDQVEARARLHPGRLAGTVHDEHWHLTYVRSTTPIYGGQSGGALVDGEGRVIGVSGLEADDGTALSLRGDQVISRVRRILAGKGTPWESEPSPAVRRQAAVASEGLDGVAAFHVPPAAEDRTVTLEVRASAGAPMVAISTLRSAQWPTRASASVFDHAGDGWWVIDDQVAPLRTAGIGRWRFSLDAFADRIVTVSGTEPGAHLTFRSSAPFVPVEVEDPVRTLGVPGRARAYVDAVDDDVPFELDLPAGTTVRITARSPSGDAEWEIASAEDGDDGRTVRDGGGGLFDADASGAFTARTGGRYLLWVYDVGGTATAVDVQVAKA